MYEINELICLFCIQECLADTVIVRLVAVVETGKGLNTKLRCVINCKVPLT